MILLVVLGWLSFNIKFLSPVARAIQGFSLSDMYYEIDWQEEGSPEISKEITLIDITELTNRAEIAGVIEDVRKCEPSVIGVDIIFEDQNYDMHGDMVLMDVAESSNAIFAKKLTDYNVKTNSFQNQTRSYFATDRIKEGYVNAIGDMSSTCLRKFSIERSLRGEPQRSFTSLIAEAYSGRSIPTNKTDDRFINYRFIDFPVVSYDSVLANRDLIKGRAVLIGTINEEADMHFTPLGKMAGLKVQAYSVQTIIDLKDIETIPKDLLMVLSILICYITVLLQFHWIRFIKASEKPFCVFLANSNLFLRFITFTWLAILALMTYIAYERLSLYIPMALILTPVILVAEARGIYKAIISGLVKARPDSIFNKSPYLKL
ncbi:CHASE2 domain-containing protein [Xylanibacter muris]|nr:CHASE2 domain-containing protein [Xylanibacter muris]